LCLIASLGIYLPCQVMPTGLRFGVPQLTALDPSLQHADSTVAGVARGVAGYDLRTPIPNSTNGSGPPWAPPCRSWTTVNRVSTPAVDHGARIMVAVSLCRTREALRMGQQSLDELATCTQDPDGERFRYRFVSCIGMVRRIGSVLDDETNGFRTNNFGNWWKTTSQDPLFLFVNDVRNDDFKDGRNRKNVHHARHVYDAAQALDELCGRSPDSTSMVPFQVQRSTLRSRSSVTWGPSPEERMTGKRSSPCSAATLIP
jgi:hypothetical protein